MYFQCPGRLKLTDQHIIFKNSKTGKVEQITASDLDVVNWQRLVGTWVIEFDHHPSSRQTVPGDVVTINADGTFTIGSRSGKWAINGNNIAFWGNVDFSGSYSYFLTPNGRSLFVPGLAAFQKR